MYGETIFNDLELKVNSFEAMYTYISSLDSSKYSDVVDTVEDIYDLYLDRRHNPATYKKKIQGRIIKENPIAILTGTSKTHRHYRTYLNNGMEINFKVPKDETIGFGEEEPSIRVLAYVKC